MICGDGAYQRVEPVTAETVLFCFGFTHKKKKQRRLLHVSFQPAHGMDYRQTWWWLLSAVMNDWSAHMSTSLNDAWIPHRLTPRRSFHPFQGSPLHPVIIDAAQMIQLSTTDARLPLSSGYCRAVMAIVPTLASMDRLIAVYRAYKIISQLLGRICIRERTLGYDGL